MRNTKHNFLLLAFLALLATQTNAQQFFFSDENPSSCGAADGIITIVPTQGVPPFTYLWSTGSTALSLRNVTKGTYDATITDASGATVTHTHILNSKDLDLYLSDAKPATYCNPNAGALTVDPVGGLAPYTYVWSTGQGGATVSGLSIGTYTVTATDATGCTAVGAYEVKWISGSYYPQASVATLQEPNCTNPALGELRAGMDYSGYGPYSYLWSNGATGESVTGLSVGVYTVTVTDALGCARSTNTAVKNELVLTNSVVCTGANTGSVLAQLTNGTAPITYAWNNGQNGPSLSNLASGTYLVTAVDANGCGSSGQAAVNIPYLTVQDQSPKCYAGNTAIGYAWVNFDSGTSYLWDNGITNAWNTALTSGPHTVTVTTALGCTLTKTLNIAPPIAPPITITTSAVAADCAAGTGGALNVLITGGTAPYSFYAYGANGFSVNNIGGLQNLQGGQYSLNVFSTNNSCSAYSVANVPDAGGFNPRLVWNDIDCNTGYGSAAILDVTMPGVQYNWSLGAITPDVYNLTAGCYSVTVTGGASCVKYYEFCLYGDDTLQFTNVCHASLSGTLINDLGVAGCTGATGIPYQLLRTLPSGALNLTDANGVYNAAVPAGTFSVQPANYNLADIVCPPTGTYTVNTLTGTTYSGLDFHFYNATAQDHRIHHRALRTAQPGYPYSTRFEICNDGNTANAGTVDLEFGNFLGSAAAAAFSQHTGAFAFGSENSGTPNNTANFTFPGITPGGCELLQVDFVTPTSTALNTAFLTRATVSPSSGDPTPDNNISTLQSTVVGSFDPNSVFAFPARNGNPHDGGEILRNVDNRITYQIFFQNTGNAAADNVVVRDTLDHQLNLATLRNLTASHAMKVSIEGDNDVLVFRFPNINLQDSTTDYAGSIGSIQYEMDLVPGLPVGATVEKSAAIYFDFNPPVITNNNVLKVVNTTSTPTPATEDNAIVVFPNPAASYFGLHSEVAGAMGLYNSLGQRVSRQTVAAGLQQISTADLPNGIYLLRLEVNGKIRNGKVVVRH